MYICVWVWPYVHLCVALCTYVGVALCTSVWVWPYVHLCVEDVI